MCPDTAMTNPAWLKARREASERLNLAVRRIREFGDERQWTQSVADATDGFCERAAVFVVNGGNLELRAARKIEAKPLSVALAAAPAFASTVESKDPLVALRTKGELSEPIATLTGEAPESRCSLFPLLKRGRVAAILYADGVSEPSAIELLSSFGSAVLDGIDLPSPSNQFQAIQIEGLRSTVLDDAKALGPD